MGNEALLNKTEGFDKSWCHSLF